MLRGGISDPRNKTLMKMFNMIVQKELAMVFQIFIKFGRMKVGQCLWWKKVIILREFGFIA